MPKVTRQRAKSDLGDAKTRFLFRLVLKERESLKFLIKGKKLRNPNQSSIGQAACWKIIKFNFVLEISKIVTARRHAKSDRRRAKSDPSTCQKWPVDVPKLTLAV